MLKHIPFITRNALRNRRRSLLTVASIAVSLCLLGVLLAMYKSLFHAPDTSADAALRVITRHKVSLTQQLPIAHLPQIRQVPGVKAVTTWTWFQGTYKRPQDFFARFAADPETFSDVYPDLKLSPEHREAWVKERTGCIAGRALVKRFNWQMGERITLVGDIFPVTLELKLVGIYEDTEESQNLFFSNDYLRESLDADSSRRDMIGTFIAAVDRAENVPRVTKAIDALFANSPYPTLTETERQFALGFVAFLGNLKLFLAIISAAVLFTVLLVSANTVAMTVRERTREIAILRTLGYSPQDVLGMILGEAGLLGAIGGLIGALLATGLSLGLVMMMKASGGGFRLFPPGPGDWGLLLVVAILIGIFSAIAPAIIASRRSVVESVRYAG